MRPQRPLWRIEARAMNINPINLAEKLSGFSDLWSPKIVAGFNGHDVMVVKVKRRVQLALASRHR
jgi:hypothetical protein